MKREFLTAISPKNAIDIIESIGVTLKTEPIHIEEALDRVLAKDIISEEDIPPFSRSLVDGYAVNVKDTQGAKETNPSLLTIKGEVRVGEESFISLENGKAISITTGAMLPQNADGVVMEEYTRRLQDEIEVTKPIFKGENICFMGEDIKKGERLKSQGERLTAFDLGVCAALGISHITVYKNPAIAIISSGDEVVDIEKNPPLGKIRDINRYTITNLLKKEGVQCNFLGIAKDAIHDISTKLEAAKAYDMTIVSGGSSKGERDFIVDAIVKLGGNILFHGVNIKPGKPVIFGTLWGKPVFGLPGHPVSCILVLIRFVMPLIRKLKGELTTEGKNIKGILATNVPSSYGIEEYIRVTTNYRGETLTIHPLFAKSSVISPLSQASGYIVVPEGLEGYEKGEEVEVFTWQ